MNSELERLRKWIDGSNRVAILSGAGVSTLSGIRSFRGKGGVYYEEYNGVNPSTILSRIYFKRNKREFWEYLNSSIVSNEAKPNGLHFLPVHLDNESKLSGVLTQNIDGLYQKAGVASNKLVEIHGNCNYGICEKCKTRYMLSSLSLNKNGIYLSPCCNRVIEPDIVLYDDTFQTKEVKRYFQVLSESDLLIVMGTSLVIPWHKDNVIDFNGKIVLLNDTSVSLESWAGMRNWDDEILVDFNTLF